LIRDKFDKEVAVPDCGHILISVHPIKDRCETQSCSIGFPLFSKANQVKRTLISEKIEKQISSIFNSFVDKITVKSKICIKWDIKTKAYYVI
jgi:hypothetical protein